MLMLIFIIILFTTVILHKVKLINQIRWELRETIFIKLHIRCKFIQDVFWRMTQLLHL